jgi:hypothetical protein
MKRIGAIVCVGFPLLATGSLEAQQNLSLEDLPPAVRATVDREVADGDITEIEEERERGRVVYEVEFLQSDREFEIEVAPDGTLLKRKEE